MYMAVLSMIMSQSKAQIAAGIAAMKIVVNAGEKNVTEMTGIMKNYTVDSNLSDYLDISV